mgnify:CR=1 FL=1
MYCTALIHEIYIYIYIYPLSSTYIHLLKVRKIKRFRKEKDYVYNKWKLMKNCNWNMTNKKEKIRISIKRKALHIYLILCRSFLLDVIHRGKRVIRQRGIRSTKIIFNSRSFVEWHCLHEAVISSFIVTLLHSWTFETTIEMH